MRKDVNPEAWTLWVDDHQQHFVYRCYDKDGDLIYIGCTSNMQTRMSAHRRGGKAASRWLAVCMTRHEVEGPFVGRIVAREVERGAIADESPVFNQNERREVGWIAKGDIARYLVERGHVDLARATACTCWREDRAAGFRDSWCSAHRDEDRPVLPAESAA